MKIALVGAAVALAALIVMAFLLWQSLEKLDAIEGGVVVGLEDVSDEIGEQQQGIVDMAARLVELEERAATPHEFCWWVSDEQEYAATQWNRRYDNNIYKQQIWGARGDMLALLAAIWNCPFQAAWGFADD